MSKDSSHPPASVFLEQMLLLAFVIHVVASLSMALLLLPGVPGGSNVQAFARAAYVAQHPLLWRLGWLPWQITAGVDLLVGVALLRAAWIPRVPAVIGMGVTLAAVVPDQISEFRWVTEGVRLAEAAVRGGNVHEYERFEQAVMLGIGGYAGIAYTLMGIAWSWCFAAAGTWSRVLTGLSIPTWILLGFPGVGFFLPVELQPAAVVVAISNAGGFVLLLIWLALVTEAVLRRVRPEESHGRYAPWRLPRRDAVSRMLEWLGNSRFARAFGEWIPPVAFVSDITDVIYVNYVVDEADR
jgi:hypothetical protein